MTNELPDTLRARLEKTPILLRGTTREYLEDRLKEGSYYGVCTNRTLGEPVLVTSCTLSLVSAGLYAKNRAAQRGLTPVLLGIRHADYEKRPGLETIYAQEVEIIGPIRPEDVVVLDSHEKIEASWPGYNAELQKLCE